MKLGSVIQEIRRKRDISQGDLAKQLNISQTYLSQIEGDKKTPSMDMLQEISTALGVPVYYLMFKGLEPGDKEKKKRESYQKLSPAITSMIEGFFIE
ncbi:MAG: helix-turn-helix transcriptional regulator [Lewinellaceae bacterium]|nr:helix-turn-helix transcriptional regulator [Lewinellaceae bacterium]